MSAHDSNSRATWILHIAAWLVYLTLHATIWSDHVAGSFSRTFVDNLLLLPPKLLLVYVCLLVLVPKYLLPKRYVTFIIALTGLVLLATIVNQFYIHYALGDVSDDLWDIERLSKRLTFLCTPMLVALTFEGIKLNTQLQKEKLTTELALLKNQLQPHFFFNTLNNLYSLVLQKSDLAPDLILKLSDMMRYILTGSTRDTVSLREEIDFIQNYVAIEKIRYGKKVNIVTAWPASLPAIAFPPLILFTFIENAFKHGVTHEIDEATIHIVLNIDRNAIRYEVKNSVQPYTQSALDIKTGIGLRNLELRLRLIYGDKASLCYCQDENTFTASLSIAV